MVRVALVRDKVRRLRATVAALQRSLPADAARLRDPDLLDLVAFRVYLGMQQAIDLAAHLVSDEGWGPAPTLREQFSILAARGVLDGELAERLAAGVKIRNLVGHAYAEIDPARMHAAASELPALLEGFCAAVLKYAEASGPA